MRATVRIFALVLASFPLFPLAEAQSAAAPAPSRDADLQLVVVLSRHGVRSPLTSQAELDKYSAAPWPKWEVAPGLQTAHGNQLIRIFGAWDRTRWSSEGLLSPAGCGDTAHVTIVADTDQRTRETGKALAEGIFPGCDVAVHSQPDGTVDPLFRSPAAAGSHRDLALVVAAVEGRIGGDPKQLTEVYRPQLTALERVLTGCEKLPVNPQRTSIFDAAATLKPGSSGAPNFSHTPLAMGSTLAENLLLEYTQGMSDAGWGCLDGATLRYLMQLDTANWDYGSRTPTISRMNAANLLDRIEKTMEQGASGKAVAGAVGKPGDKLVILVGHDSNISAVAGALNIDWVFDGRVDDTPPGGALLFELWRPRDGGKPYVRLEYIAQTLEQMRNSEPLTPANPPAVVPIFIPGCGRQDLSCTWEGFVAAMRASIDPAYVAAQP